MRAPRLALALLCLLAASAIAGCGGDPGTADSTAGDGTTATGRPAPPKSAFPAPEGRSLREVLKAADGPAEAVVSPAAMAFYPGLNRYPFGVSERDHTPVSDAEVALYYAKVPAPERRARSKAGNRGQQAKAEAQALDEPAVGPFPAVTETLATEPAFRARTTSEDADAASVVYAAQLPFSEDGEWRIAAILREGGELKGALLPGVTVGGFRRIPQPGQKAPLVHTPTAQDAGGDLSKITTRIPPDTQNKVDYADALGKEPIVLLFATPQFCQSRVCGPVVDVAEQAQQEFGNKAAFIHMEIYNDNDPAERVRPQVRAFHLPTEPWLFTIDRAGVVRDAVEGAFGLELMHEAVEKAIAP
ncbi:MAG TPA: hypothetical protein VN732_04780 [Solirubrobacterales bacterium]|nr:hypothetical protein [Solirubrobacterales bacterium]